MLFGVAVCPLLLSLTKNHSSHLSQLANTATAMTLPFVKHAAANNVLAATPRVVLIFIELVDENEMRSDRKLLLSYFIFHYYYILANSNYTIYVGIHNLSRLGIRVRA